MMQIRKIILITTIVLISSSFSFAQFTHLGIKGGLNFSKVNYNNDLQSYDHPFKAGFNAGLFGEFELNGKMSLYAEVIYSQRGNKYYFDGNSEIGQSFVEHTFIQELDYIDILILFQYKFPTKSNFTPKIFAGPLVSFLLSANLEYEEQESKGEIDVKELIQSSEFGVVFGIGTDSQLPSNKIIFDIRYNLGLTNINNNEEGSEFTSGNISINQGYGFEL